MKEVYQNFKNYDYAIIFLCLLLISFSLTQFFKNQFKDNLNKLEMIASIESLKDNVRAKHRNQLIWINALKGHSLANGDKIFTDESSTAQVHFFNGTKIYIDEKSLIKIQKNQLNINKGSLSINTSSNKSITVFIANEKIEIIGKESQIRIENNKIEVEKGLVKIKKKELITELAENEILNVEKLATKYKVPFKVVTPLNNKNIYQDTDLIELKFKKLVNTNTKFLLSNDTKFKKIIRSIDNPEESLKISLNKNQTYYWTIKEDGQPIIKYSKFNFIKLTAPTINEPNNSLTVTKLPYIVNFSDGGFTRFQIETDLERKITTKPYFVIEKELKKITITGIKEKIRLSSPNYEVKSILNSNLKTKLLYPGNNHKVLLFSDEFIEQIFHWEQKENIPNDFELNIFNTKTKNKIHKLTKKTKESIKLSDSGIYQWKVKQGNENWSIISNFEIEKKKYKQSELKNGIKFTLHRPEQVVEFEWQKDGTNYVYEFEISQNKDFKNSVYTKITKENYIKTALGKTGKFFWRTKRLLENGEQVFMQPKKVIIEKSPPPLRPTLPYKTKQKIRLRVKDLKKSQGLIQKVFIINAAFAQEFDEFIALSWNKDKNAKFYHLEIYSDPDMKNLVRKEKIKENVYEYSLKKNKKTLYWRIAVEDHWGQISPFSNVSQIDAYYENKHGPTEEQKLIPKSTPEKIVLITPNNDEAFKNPKSIKFQWNNTAKRETTLIIAKDKNFKKIIFNKVSNKQSFILKVKNLQDTQLYWKVTSNDLTSSTRSLNIANLKTIKVAMEEEDSKSYSNKANTLAFGIGPAITGDTQNENGVSVEIDGTAINSIKLLGTNRINERVQYLYEFHHRGGKVFENLSYSYSQFNIGTNFQYHPLFQLKGFANFTQNTAYITSTSNVMETKKETHIGASVFAGIYGKFNKQWTGDLDLGYSLGGVSGLQLRGQLTRALNKRIYSMLHGQYRNEDSDTESGQLESQVIEISIGLGYIF